MSEVKKEIKKIQPVGRRYGDYSKNNNGIVYGRSGEHKVYQQITRLIEKGKTDQVKKIEGVVLSDLSYKEAVRLSNKLKKKYIKKVDKILDGYEANMAAINDEYSTFSEANLSDSIDDEKIKEMHNDVGRYTRIKNDNLPQSTILMLEPKEYEAIDMKVRNLDIAFQELFKEEINSEFKEVLEIDLDKEVENGKENS